MENAVKLLSKFEETIFENKVKLKFSWFNLKLSASITLTNLLVFSIICIMNNYNVLTLEEKWQQNKKSKKQNNLQL
jgi:hypothetical protein